MEFPIFPLVLAYAEIHYRFKKLSPAYYRKQPEIIADIPHRLIKSSSNKLPVLLIIKDSHLFPVHLQDIKINLFSSTNKTCTCSFILDQHLAKPYHALIREISLADFNIGDELQVKVIIRYRCNETEFTVENDNYHRLTQTVLKVKLIDPELFGAQGWFAGEPHYHSNFTEDQVEFGADLNSTVELARVMGLSWLFVTDHSYDLDDLPGSWTEIDQGLAKWTEMRAQCRKLDTADLRIIPGEELSIGNSKDKNVHLLVIANSAFIPGRGDSAEIWFQNRPTHNISELPSLLEDTALLAAAHPFEKIPWSQKLTLRRGNWRSEDLLSAGIRFLQLINSNNPRQIKRSLNRWKKYLLRGHRFLIIAGNDAHGNFNIMRQIKIPFLRLFTSRKQIFGKFMTLFQYPENDPLPGLIQGRVIVSNGPFLDFTLSGDDQTVHIGQVSDMRRGKLNFKLCLSEEQDRISRFRLHIGDLESKREQIRKNPPNGCELTLPARGYIRMSLLTKRGGMAFTNPIWISAEINDQKRNDLSRESS
ncbi:MAG: CehA/McbA family metallohydrolase [Candidatus Cloacimonetes bacterium]|nr:CehA/McbA family metallohydrolase [Candidatus Cloacimonadota bacterium]